MTTPTTLISPRPATQRAAGTWSRSSQWPISGGTGKIVQAARSVEVSQQTASAASPPPGLVNRPRPSATSVTGSSHRKPVPSQTLPSPAGRRASVFQKSRKCDTYSSSGMPPPATTRWPG